MLKQENGRIIYHYDAEELWIESWGKNAVRIRATKNAEMPKDNWALLSAEEVETQIEITEDGATLRNGKVKVSISNGGKITIYNQKGKLLLEEYWRNRRDLRDSKCSAIEVEAREF